MEQDNKKPKTLGLAVYIPLALTICFMFLGFSALYENQIYIFGFIPNPFYSYYSSLTPEQVSWNIGGLIWIVFFWFLTIASLVITVAMVITRTALVKLRKENKPVSKKANIIAAILIFLVIFIVWYIDKFGIY